MWIRLVAWAWGSVLTSPSVVSRYAVFAFKHRAGMSGNVTAGGDAVSGIIGYFTRRSEKAQRKLAIIICLCFMICKIRWFMDFKETWSNIKGEAWAYAHDVAGRIGRLHAYYRIPKLTVEVDALRALTDVDQGIDVSDFKYQLRAKSSLLSTYKGKLWNGYDPVANELRDLWEVMSSPRAVFEEMLLSERKIQVEAITDLANGRSPEDSGAMG